MGLFTLCSYLKTKESYDRWVTRRLWGLRHQISKAKKSQNVGRTYREASGEHRDTVYWEKNSPGKRYHRIQTCLIGEVETSSSPIRRQASDVKYPEKVECQPDEIPGVRYPDSPRGHVARSPIRTPSGRSTRHSRTSLPDNSISYPDMLSGSLTKVSKPCYVISTACHSPRFAAISMVCPGALSGHLCYGFQRTLLNLGLLWW